jgi:hypothetical protein
MSEHHHHDEEEEFEEVDFEDILRHAPDEVQEMVALSIGLATSLAAQNEILAQQRENLLQIALTTADAVQALVKGAKAPAKGGLSAELTEAIERLREIGSNLQATADQLPETPTLPAFQPADSEPAGDDFRQQALATMYAGTARALTTASQSTIAAQQQLHTLGAAILTQSVNLLYDVATQES